MKGDRFAIWFPLALLITLAALTTWLDYKVQPPAPKRDGSNRHDPDYYLENFSTTRMGPDGNIRYVLSGKKLMHYPDDDSTHLNTPKFTHLTKNKPPMNISSDQGLVSRDGEHAYFMGNVQVLRQAKSAAKPPVKLATSYLHVIPNQDFAETDKAVTITDANTIISGVGLELNNKTRILRLLSQVKTHYEKPKR
jgi:lipopolysaccharide export system protein LptC